MKQNEINELIFSSSASIYGQSDIQPITEQAEIKLVSVYAKTKAAAEKYN